jgi:hypothetical protein
MALEQLEVAIGDRDPGLVVEGLERLDGSLEGKQLRMVDGI